MNAGMVIIQDGTQEIFLLHGQDAHVKHGLLSRRMDTLETEMICFPMMGQHRRLRITVGTRIMREHPGAIQWTKTNDGNTVMFPFVRVGKYIYFLHFDCIHCRTL